MEHPKSLWVWVSQVIDGFHLRVSSALPSKWGGVHSLHSLDVSTATGFESEALPSSHTNRKNKIWPTIITLINCLLNLLHELIGVISFGKNCSLFDYSAKKTASKLVDCLAPLYFTIHIYSTKTHANLSGHALNSRNQTSCVRLGINFFSLD